MRIINNLHLTCIDFLRTIPECCKSLWPKQIKFSQKCQQQVPLRRSLYTIPESIVERIEFGRIESKFRNGRLHVGDQRSHETDIKRRVGLERDNAQLWTKGNEIDKNGANRGDEVYERTRRRRRRRMRSKKGEWQRRRGKEMDCRGGNKRRGKDETQESGNWRHESTEKNVSRSIFSKFLVKIWDDTRRTLEILADT